MSTGRASPSAPARYRNRLPVCVRNRNTELIRRGKQTNLNGKTRPALACGVGHNQPFKACHWPAVLGAVDHVSQIKACHWPAMLAQPSNQSVPLACGVGHVSQLKRSAGPDSLVDSRVQGEQAVPVRLGAKHLSPRSGHATNAGL